MTRTLLAGIIIMTLGVAVSTMGADGWSDQQQALYTGPAVETQEDLAPYTGVKAARRIVGKDRRAAYMANYRQLGINYGGGVEFQLRREQVILCPQTMAHIYGAFTPLQVRYERGSRPRLEQVVAKITTGRDTERAKVLALMRFCRDLRNQPGLRWDNYIYGGTEEQMIDKPEILCETLGRLMVALCEVTGIPGRIIMHDLGGHIVSEIHVEGSWAYIDPRCGMYFLKPDGNFASLLDICRSPSLIDNQPDAVKADVSDVWTWSFRAWKVRNMYCNENEVNGFQNYSLADAEEYSFLQVPRQTAETNGLLTINKKYVRTAHRALGLLPQPTGRSWRNQTLKKIDIAYRHDGFSIFFKKPPMNRKELYRRYLDPFENSNVGTLVWGVGPGSVFCYETKVGEIFGEGLTDPQRRMLRPGDRWVHENVMGLIKEGGGPMQMAVARAHQLGKKLIARLEMNHEYGPAKDDNWMWVAFVGSLNKKHPEYRIGRGVLLDYKHQEVRDFKLAILRETVQLGADGVSLDFAVYPPFFAKADPGIMTQFVRDVRAMLDQEGRKRGQHLDLAVRVPSVDWLELGLDWPAWMEERLIDLIFPTHRRFPDYFDNRVEQFIAAGLRTGIPVYPTVWQALGFVNTDSDPSDTASGRRRYDKPKTAGMFRAQALMFMRAGAQGIQLGMSEDQWRGKPWMNELGDPAKLLFADKHYMVDPIHIRPGTIELRKDKGKFTGTMALNLRVADDVKAARKAGHQVKATLVVYCQPLAAGERLAIRINGRDPVAISGDTSEAEARRNTQAIDPSKGNHKAFIFQKDWWKRGEHRIDIPGQWWRLGDNHIRLAYSAREKRPQTPFTITWVDLLLDYSKE